jgi:hypothetical protein
MNLGERETSPSARRLLAKRETFLPNEISEVAC